MKKPIKYCKSPDCGDIMVEYKSSKKEYCSDYCRNHHGYLRRTEEKLEFINFMNRQIENYKVLKLHKDAGILKETLEKYEKFGFNPFYLPAKKIYEKNEKKHEYYTIKDIAFKFNSIDKSILILNIKP